MSCGKVLVTYGLLSYFLCEFGIVGLFVCTSVPLSLSILQFCFEKVAASVKTSVSFLYVTETLSLYEKYDNQTLDQSCCARCHLSIANGVSS